MKIEKGVPIPTGSRIDWPFDQMEVGDSLEIPADIGPRRAKNAASSYERTHNWKFAIRKTGENTWRLWRTA